MIAASQSAQPVESGPSSSVERVDLVEFSRDLFHGIRSLHEKYGPIAAIEDGGQRVVFLFHPEFNQQVLSDTERFHARFFAVRGPKQSAQRRLTCGLLAMNGEQHRRNRRIVKEPFSLRSIAGYGPTIARLTDEMLDTWRWGAVYDIAEEMRQFMLRVTSTLLFGLQDPEPAYRLGDMIARWVSLNQEIGAGALVPNERFSQRYEELLEFARELEADILSMIRQRRKDKRTGRDVLSILVETRDQAGGLSEEELLGQTAVLFAAAHMTTAHSLTWTMLLLSQFPSVMRRLWEELGRVTEPTTTEWQVDAASTNYGLSAADSLPVTAGTMKSPGVLPKGEQLPLLDCIIKESMRLMPASAYSQRINTTAVQLGPYHLPRGTGIVFTPLVTHHLAEIYAQPQKFLPNRWQSLRPSPYAYHPFGAGPRLCIGAPLAMAIIRIALRKIFTRCRLQVVRGSEVDVHVESTMLMPSKGLPMQVFPADGRFASSPIGGRVHELVDFDEAPAFVSGDEAPGPGDGQTSAAPRVPR